MASSSGSGKRKREPGKRCVVMLCNNTNANGVSMHQFPKEEKIRQKWIEFVLRKRDPKSWTPGSGYICSNHFVGSDFENYYAKLNGLCSKLLLRREAVPSVQPIPQSSSTSNSEQQKKSRVESTRESNALTKLRAHRVSSVVYGNVLS